MATGRLYFDGDKIYTEKKKRTHKLTPEVEQKIDAIPWVVDDASSISTTDALSARMGHVLQEQINELKSMWRFLSTWNCQAWLPTTDPLDDPYDYRIGDYYIVSEVSQQINYRPFGATYISWQASVTVETEAVKINDWYLYDGNSWILQSQSQVTIVIDQNLDTTSNHAIANQAVANALLTKQNVISDLSSIRAGAAAWLTAVQPWDSLSVLDNTQTGYQTAGDVASAVAWKADTSDVTALWNRVTAAESAITSQWQAIADLQQSEGWTAWDVSDLKDDVADIKDDISDINTALAWKVDSSSLGAVATSNDYNDLDNLPTIPTPGNGQVTITQTTNGTTVTKGSFTLDQSWNTTINLDDTNTTYSTVTKTDVQTGTSTTAGVVTPVMLSEALVRIASNTSWNKTKIWTGTQAEYEALGSRDSDCLYFTVDSSS